MATDGTIGELVAERLRRRTVLRGLAATTALAGCAAPGRRETAPASFEALAHGLDGTHHVPKGYRADILVRWGDPILAGTPDFDPARPSAAAQARQWGYNNDFLAYMPLPRDSRNSWNGLLFANNEYVNRELMWPGFAAGAERPRGEAEIEMAAHGLGVVEVRRDGGRWRVVTESRYNRRFTATTPFAISGPAAGSGRLRTGEDPEGTRALGTLGNCAGGVTPWGTALSGEENIHNYFTGTGAGTGEARNHATMGLRAQPRFEWAKVEPRFVVATEPNEPNRFGWVVEVDPYDPASVPVKRTALGRCKHEGATCVVGRGGRVAVYTGDDERYQHVYKFVAERAFDPVRPTRNRNLLDSGTLYAARFEAGGKMRWLPLVHGTGPLTAANGFRDQADVLIETRRAAELLGATRMDRPEDIQPDPRTGRVYIACTFNEQRKPGEVDPANPRAANRYGHIIELVPPGEGTEADHAAEEFRWEVFLLGGDPAKPEHGARYGGEPSPEGWLACPDNLAFDPQGRLWVATDGQDDTVGIADSAYVIETQGPRRGAPKLFFNGPRGAEVTGPCFTPDGTTLFLAVQHPGAEKGSTFDKPSTRWPDFRDGMPPRPSVLAITRDDGGPVGG